MKPTVPVLLAAVTTMLACADGIGIASPRTESAARLPEAPMAALEDIGLVTLTYSDATFAQGDQVSAAGDVTSVQLVFDLIGGTYQATWTADPARPFNGNVRFNLNLGNTRLGGALVALTNSFGNVSSQTQLSYTGTAPTLTTWMAGDAIVSTGNTPQFLTAFNSGLVDLDNTALTNRDLLQQISATIIPGDGDGDGVPNIDDYCPGTPAGTNVDADGCLATQRIELLVAQVDALFENGTLTTDQTSGLKAKLTAADASINAGRTVPACGKLEAFVNQVQALVNSGALTSAVGGQLQQAALATRQQIGC